jgi:hypothetical protein
LERKDSQILDGNLGLNDHRILGVKDKEALKWDWRAGRDDIAEPGGKTKAEKEEMGMEKRRVTVI